MYFSNIANEELQHFHNKVKNGFNISLSKLLLSDLFNINAVNDNMFFICPLFYCDEIISSNPSDKILSNRGLIVTRQDDSETYISFKVYNKNETILLDEDILNIKNINDSLSTDEFNGIVFCLRKLGVLNGNLNFHEINNIVGDYGTYTFSNIEDKIKTDAGLIINNNMKENPVTVKLENPFFLNANYILKFKVKSLTGANVCQEGSADFKHEDTFSIELSKDNDTEINISDYVNDSVLLYDVMVEINFNTPEIINSNFGLSITADNPRISLGSEINLTATLTGEHVKGYNVQFFEDGQPIPNGIKSTNDNGVAELTYQPSASANHIYSCNVLGLNANVNVIVYNKNTILNIETSDTSIRVDNEITITGVLTDGEQNPLADMPIILYENNNIIDDNILTNAEGEFVKILNKDLVNNYSYQAIFNSMGGYLSADSNIANVEVYKYNSQIQLSAPETVYVPNYFTVTGNLIKEGLPFSNAVIKLYNDNNLIGEVVTNENGDFEKSIYAKTPLNYKFKAEYEGTSKIASAVITNINTNARKIKTYVSCTPNKTVFYPNEVLTLTGSITDEFGNVLGQSRKITLNGKYHSYSTSPYNINITMSEVGTKSYKVGFESGYVNGGWIGSDYAKYDNADSNIVYVRCVKYPVTVNVLDDAESYTCGDSILINVTSEDNNFNPSSITVEFNGNSYVVTSKNNQGQFIFEIPEIIDLNNYFDITATFNGDSTHESAYNTKNIHVYNSVQNLVLSKNGTVIIVTTKNKNNQVMPNCDISPLTFNFTGFSQITSIIIEDGAITDSNGQISLDLRNISGTGTITATWNGIVSNTINFSNTTNFDGGSEIHI